MNKTKNKTNRIGALLPLFFIVAPILTALRSVEYLRIADLGNGHFEDSTIITICNVATTVMAIIFMTHAFSHHRKDSIPYESFSGSPAAHVSSATMAVAICYAIYELIASLVKDGALVKIEGARIVTVASALLGVCALAFLLLNVIIEERHNQLNAALGIAAALFFTSYGMFIHFDTSVAANVPQRIITTVAIMLCAVFMLYEARIPLGRSKWHSYVAFGLAASLTLFYSSVPALVYYFVKGQAIIGATLIQQSLSITAAIYIIVRVCIIAFAPEDEVCDLADSILDMVHRRRAKNDAHARVNNLKEE